MKSPAEFQRLVFNVLAVLGLSRTLISRERNGTFSLKTCSIAEQVMYVALRVNTVAKFTFLVLLSCGYFQAEFEFFEKMAIALWFLIMLLLATSERLWYRKYPFFEILTAWWRIEERIYERLGRPEQFVKDVRRMAINKVWFQGIIALVGVLAVCVQYDAAPKYCVFAYSLIESEDPVLKWLFGAHEILFLTHAWLVYGSVIYISSAIGSEFTYSIEALEEVLETFIDNRHIKRALGPHGAFIPAPATARKRKRFSRGLSLIADDNQLINEVRTINLSTKIRDMEYNPMSIVREYVHIHMVVTQLNKTNATPIMVHQVYCCMLSF